MRSERAFILSLVVLTVACNSKSPGPDAAAGPIVARVGTHTISKNYYEERIAKMERKFLPDTLDMAGKRKFLDTIINKEVMALKAEDLGYADDPDLQQVLQSFEETLLHNKSVELAIQDKIGVTEEEIQAFYDKSKEDVLVKHILLPTHSAAEEVVEELRAGADFDSMVDVHSLVPRTAADGSDIPLQQRAIFGWLSYGEANPEVERAAFDTPMSQYSDPVLTAYGWHIFMPYSRRDHKRPPFADEHDRIQRQIEARKRRSATNEYYESILKDHGFVMHDDALAIAFDKLPPDPQDFPDPNTEVKPIIDYTYQERQMPLFEVDGKTYTIGDFSDRYDSTNFQERPKKWTGSQGLYFWIRDVWMKPLQVEQARKDGVDKLPEVATEIKLRREMFMVGGLHNRLIDSQTPEPTEEQIQETYNKHADAYVEKEKRVCNLIYHLRERVVRRAYEEIQGGADFVETAIRYNDNAVKPEDVRTAAFSEDDEKHAELVSHAFALDLKGISEPFKTKEGWVCLQVEQIIPKRQFALDEIRDTVIQDWKTEWGENRLNELLQEWKKEYPITVDDEVLSKVHIDRDDVYVPAEG